MQSVCENTTINCNKLVKITNLLASKYTESSIKQKQTLTTHYYLCQNLKERTLTGCCTLLFLTQWTSWQGLMIVIYEAVCYCLKYSSANLPAITLLTKARGKVTM